MAEVGECSSAVEETFTWARLVPSDSRHSDVELRSNDMNICTEITSSSSDKHEWCKIIRNSDRCSATIQNKSSNTILVDEAVLPKEDVMDIICGSEIIPGPDREGYLSYKFKLMPTLKPHNNQLKISMDIEHAKCSICLNVWHDVVTVGPCLHNFCNGCFSEWLRRSESKRSSIVCPQCRAVVQSVGRNHFLHNIEEAILQADSSLKRPAEELAHLDSYASIQSSRVIGIGKRLRQKRSHSSVDEESEGAELTCPQCGTEFGGFQCNPNTVHIQCHECRGMMPSRTDINVPQHCLGCDRACCGAYWRAQRVTRSDYNPLCSHETFKPIGERTINRVPSSAHEGNQHEQDITERCIRQMGRTIQDVISEWVAKLNNREIDRSRMPLNHAEMITATTHVCNGCFDKLVSFLLYWFRISLPNSVLPQDANGREDCWYGYACRTQHRNVDHARRRNHVCRPTRVAASYDT